MGEFVSLIAFAVPRSRAGLSICIRFCKDRTTTLQPTRKKAHRAEGVCAAMPSTIFRSAEPDPPHPSDLLPVLATGLAGLAGLTAFEALERRLLGGPPVYAPSRIAARLLTRYAPRARIQPASAGTALRLCYAALLAGFFVRGRRFLPRSSTAAAACGGALVAGFELLALPATGATPPLGSWPRPSQLLLFLHALAFMRAAACGQRAVALARAL
jgi:hypothetical protein